MDKQLIERRKQPVLLRFWNKITPLANGCWLWKGAKSGDYGCFWYQGERIRAHRFAYECFNQKVIPLNLEPDHLCRNKLCVNPDHIEPVTHSENQLRGIGPELARQRQLSKTHCPQGHPYDEENTYYRPDKRGRECKECRKEAIKKWKGN